MKSIIRRIEKLEKRYMPAPQTAFSKELARRLAAGRERVRKYRELRGESEPSDEGLPPKKIHKSHGIQRVMDILNEGRDRVHLRWLRDKKLRESNSPPAADGQWRQPGPSDSGPGPTTITHGEASGHR